MFLTQLKLPRTRQAMPILTRFMGSKYHEHQVLWELSGRPPEAKRDFLYRTELTDAGLTVMVLSSAPFDKVEAPWQVEVKPYQPTLRSGQMLSFKMRAALSMSKSTGEGSRGQRVDLVMHRYQELDGEMPIGQVGHAVAQEWLGAREALGGFKLIEVAYESYTRHQITEKGTPFVVPTSDMTGLLEITDPELFLAKQLQGYGRNKFAGMGLMLVRWPS